jgi:DNA-binding transcriptional ArsR family regulator
MGSPDRASREHSHLRGYAYSPTGRSLIGPDKVVKGEVEDVSDSATPRAVADPDVAEVEGEDVGASATSATTAELPPDLRAELVELTSTLCKALNDPKRLMVLYALADGPRSVGELAATIDAPQANVSQHLAMLRDRGLVGTERRGNRIIYSLRYPEVVAAVETLRGVLAEEVARRQGLVGG